MTLNQLIQTKRLEIVE